jgi:hypothetical protein
MIFYTMCFQNFEKMWQILFYNALFGFIAQFFTNLYYAQPCAGYDPTILPYLLLINEFNWWMVEVTTLYYSYMKTSVVVKSAKSRRTLDIIMYIMFALSFISKTYSGVVKFQEGKDLDATVLAAQVPAAVVSALTDSVILVLLIINFAEATKNVESRSTMSIMKTLLQSSLPRITVIIMTNLIRKPASHCLFFL